MVTVNTNASANPFHADDVTNFFSGYVTFLGVGGMTQLNGQDAAVTSIGGSAGAWTATVAINSSGYSSWTSGGLMLDQNTPLGRATLLSGWEQSQGIDIIAGESGPPGSLNDGEGEPGIGRYIGYMQAYGIGTFPWAWDDGTNLWSQNSVFAFTGTGGGEGNFAFNSLYSDTTEAGMDVLLNPRTGITALANRANSL